jgi:tRNA-dihydrouridine synthase A
MSRSVVTMAAMSTFANNKTWSNNIAASIVTSLSTTTKHHERELFSVAPMMKHTNRHYRFFFRQLSRRAHLYSEMIPANQIVQAYEQVLSIRNIKQSAADNSSNYHPEQILEIVETLQESGGSGEMLDELLRLSDPKQEGPVALQLGGRDPELLAKASAIGAAYGYNSINLNCGCPSNAVSGSRSSGASLMKEPEVVAKCVEAMSHAVRGISKDTLISVKHRLGVRQVADYLADEDYAKPDQEAFEECHTFVRCITLAGDVSRIHVHARLALLGDGISPATDSSIWVPYSQEPHQQQQQQQPRPKKINHKRAQYIANGQGRVTTIQNRSVPPLRPTVVEMLASDFPHLEFVSNGGISSMETVRERLLAKESQGTVTIVGAMVGRAAINHPCSFASADSLWSDDSSYYSQGSKTPPPSRETVLQNYIAYCKGEEERKKSMVLKTESMEIFRRKLVGAPFHLFVGEQGGDAYQRRIRKLVSRAHVHSTSASSILTIALAEVPLSSRMKPVNDHIPLKDVKKYDFTIRSGPLQRDIH